MFKYIKRISVLINKSKVKFLFAPSFKSHNTSSLFIFRNYKIDLHSSTIVM